MGEGSFRDRKIPRVARKAVDIYALYIKTAVLKPYMVENARADH